MLANRTFRTIRCKDFLILRIMSMPSMHYVKHEVLDTFLGNEEAGKARCVVRYYVQ